MRSEACGEEPITTVPRQALSVVPAPSPDTMRNCTSASSGVASYAAIAERAPTITELPSCMPADPSASPTPTARPSTTIAGELVCRSAATARARAGTTSESGVAGSASISTVHAAPVAASETVSSTRMGRF